VGQTIVRIGEGVPTRLISMRANAPMTALASHSASSALFASIIVTFAARILEESSKKAVFHLYLTTVASENY
jgi:hypothetical protein